MNAHSYSLRPVTDGDSAAVWQVANDPAVRQWAFHSDPIAWEDHQQWMARQLVAAHPFFVVEDEQGAVAGYVRFAPDDDGVYTVSIGLGEPLRGRGLGAAILRQACALFFATTQRPAILAWVKCTNIASMIAFLKAGFIPDQVQSVDGVKSVGLCCRNMVAQGARH